MRTKISLFIIIISIRLKALERGAFSSQSPSLHSFKPPGVSGIREDGDGHEEDHDGDGEDKNDDKTHHTWSYDGAAGKSTSTIIHNNYRLLEKK